MLFDIDILFHNIFIAMYVIIIYIIAIFHPFSLLLSIFLSRLSLSIFATLFFILTLLNLFQRDLIVDSFEFIIDITYHFLIILLFIIPL